MTEMTINATIYQAKDGKRFLNKDECEAHEKKYKKVENDFNNLLKKETKEAYALLPDFCGEDVCIVVYVRNKEDVATLNSYFGYVDYYEYGCPGKPYFNSSHIGKFLVINHWMGCDGYNYCGTKEEYARYILSCLDECCDMRGAC